VPANDWVYGPKQYVHDIAEILGKKHEVFVWHFNLLHNEKPCVQDVENVKLVSSRAIPSKSLLIYYAVNFLPSSLAFARTVRKLEIDVVIALNLIPALWAFGLAPSKALKVFGFQDYFPESASVYYKKFPRVLRRIIETFALCVNKVSIRLADLVMCPCYSLINLSEEMGCKRTHFMTNGVDVNFFDPSKTDETLREKLGLSKNTLVFYGLLENWLDFKTVLEGLRLIKKDIPDTKLLVIGSTLTNYTKVLEKMLQETDLANDVVLTGYVPNELVPYYINLGDMCIMPYKIDNFSGKIRLPIKFFVYSSMGKPILSVALPEVKRFNPDHVFFYDNPEEFAIHARKVLKSKQLKNDLAHYARDFSKDFDFTKLAKDCETVIEQLKQ